MGLAIWRLNGRRYLTGSNSQLSLSLLESQSYSYSWVRSIYKRIGAQSQLNRSEDFNVISKKAIMKSMKKSEVVIKKGKSLFKGFAEIL